MAVETLLHQPVKLFRASYENIKITTPEDLVIADGILEKESDFAKSDRFAIPVYAVNTGKITLSKK